MLLCIFPAVTAVSCVSEEGAERRWQRFVDDHNSCETVDDCVVVYPGCPLGCWEAVSAEHEDAAIKKAEKIVKSYERGGRACAYGCVSAGELSCNSGICELGEPVDF